jgi:hypothetical protein
VTVTDYSRVLKTSAKSQSQSQVKLNYSFCDYFYQAKRYSKKNLKSEKDVSKKYPVKSSMLTIYKQSESHCFKREVLLVSELNLKTVHRQAILKLQEF